MPFGFTLPLAAGSDAVAAGEGAARQSLGHVETTAVETIPIPSPLVPREPPQGGCRSGIPCITTKQPAWLNPVS
jgi:hypothetical protein